MKETINYVNLTEEDRVLKALAEAFEKAFSGALKEVTQKTSFASCFRMEKTSLDAILKSSSHASTALEFEYVSGLEGKGIFVTRSADLFQLGEIISGVEAGMDDSLPPEIQDACLQFFGRVLDAASKAFAETHRKQMQSGNPHLVASAGPDNALTKLAESYADSISLAFQIVVDPKIDNRLQLLVTAPVLKSLSRLIPDYDPNPPVRDLAQERIAARQAREEAEKVRFEPVEVEPDRGAFSGDYPGRDSSNWNIDLLLDVELPIVVSFGETEMQLRDVVKLGVGSVLELDKAVNDPVTIVVNNKPIARGEVVMVEGNYGVRILEVESAAERIRSLG